MKKAKIMLSAIAVIAVIGGALAFKAHKNDRFTYFTCSDPTLVAGHCQSSSSTLGIDRSKTDLGGQTAITNATLTQNTNDNCTVGDCTSPLYFTPTANQ